MTIVWTRLDWETPRILVKHQAEHVGKDVLREWLGGLILNVSGTISYAREGGSGKLRGVKSETGESQQIQTFHPLLLSLLPLPLLVCKKPSPLPYHALLTMWNPGPTATKPTFPSSSLCQVFGHSDKKGWVPHIYTRSLQTRKWSWSRSLPRPVGTYQRHCPALWIMVHLNAFLVSHIALLISGQAVLIISHFFPPYACFPLDLWTYGMSNDNYFNVCLQVLHLFLFWLIVLLIKGLIFFVCLNAY